MMRTRVTRKSGARLAVMWEGQKTELLDCYCDITGVTAGDAVLVDDDDPDDLKVIGVLHT